LPSELAIELFPREGSVLITVSGELDLSSAPFLAHALARAGRLANELIVDLERVEFMDCAGLRVLMRWAGESGDRGPKIRSVTPGPRQVQRLFELTGANRLLQVVSSASPDSRAVA
jgi:anti-anti-sigma factor